nr:MAG TPA: hypothetical protein [Caudoviricetes sp.]
MTQRVLWQVWSIKYPSGIGPLLSSHEALCARIIFPGPPAVTPAFKCP